MDKEKLDFGKLKLVSFGDSYTFGQGAAVDIDYVTQILPRYQDYDIARLMWKRQSNRLSYTAQLEKMMGFKGSLNLGIPGASNKRILTTLRSYCVNHNLSDCFIVVALTHPARDLIATKRLSLKNTDAVNFMKDFIYGAWEDDKKSQVDKNLNNDISIIKNLSLNSAAEMMSAYFNNFTILSNHVITHNAIFDFLNGLGVPYIVVDILNDVPASDAHYNVLSKMRNTYLKDISKDIGVDMSDFQHIKDYFATLKRTSKTSKYLNFFALNERYETYIGTNKKIDPYMKNTDRYVVTHPSNSDRSLLSPIKSDGHWSVRGHKVFATLLKDWIEKHYEDKK